MLSCLWHPQEDAVIGFEKAGLPLKLNAECRGIPMVMLLAMNIV